jgi:hypothetical protein
MWSYTSIPYSFSTGTTLFRWQVEAFVVLCYEFQLGDQALVTHLACYIVAHPITSQYVMNGS